jgi:hypothetical protein
MTIHTDPAAFDSIKKSLVALRMPRALEMLDATLAAWARYGPPDART